MGLSAVKGLGRTEVSEVFVIGEDLDREWGSMEVILPRLQSSDNGKEFSVICTVDVIVLFCRGERLREIGAGVPFTV